MADTSRRPAVAQGHRPEGSRGRAGARRRTQPGDAPRPGIHLRGARTGPPGLAATGEGRGSGVHPTEATAGRAATSTTRAVARPDPARRGRGTTKVRAATPVPGMRRGATDHRARLVRAVVRRRPVATPGRAIAPGHPAIAPGRPAIAPAPPALAPVHRVSGRVRPAASRAPRVAVRRHRIGPTRPSTAPPGRRSVRTRRCHSGRSSRSPRR